MMMGSVFRTRCWILDEEDHFGLQSSVKVATCSKTWKKMPWGPEQLHASQRELWPEALIAPAPAKTRLSKVWMLWSTNLDPSL